MNVATEGTEMRNATKIPVNTDIYARVVQVSRTESERDEAIFALRTGEAVANGILWLINGVKHLFAGATLKLGLKHKVAV